MIKRILLTIVMLLLIAYLIAAVTVFNDKPAHQVCRDMELVIRIHSMPVSLPRTRWLPSCRRKAFIRWKENGPGTHQNIGKRVG